MRSHKVDLEILAILWHVFMGTVIQVAHVASTIFDHSCDDLILWSAGKSESAKSSYHHSPSSCE